MATTETPPTAATDLDAELAGLDALETGPSRSRLRVRTAWAATWPKLVAIALALLIWQVVVWSGWRPEYVLPGPAKVFSKLTSDFGALVEGSLTTLQRAVVGFALALVIGVVLGALVSRSKVLRAGLGSMITGLQTMPSIAWFPLAIVLFKLSEGAIYFVVVIGAAPSIANGLIGGVDHIPPVLLRAGRVLGARGFASLRHVILPAALPAFVNGLKQGWAFAWRSLLAGELLVLIAGNRTLGGLLDANRQVFDTAGLISVMIVILVIGIVVDSVLFGTLDKVIRRRYGLIDTAR